MGKNNKIKSVVALKNGPYVVTLQDDNKVALCRCGRTKNSPLCDGSHKKEEFKAASWELDVNND